MVPDCAEAAANDASTTRFYECVQRAWSKEPGLTEKVDISYCCDARHLRLGF